MIVQNGLRSKLSDLFSLAKPSKETENKGYNSHECNTSEWVRSKTNKAQGEWFSAIATLESLLLNHAPATTEPTPQGVILSGPCSVLSHPELVSMYQFGLFAPKPLKEWDIARFQLPASSNTQPPFQFNGNIIELPLLPYDPLATEQFCLVFTNQFSLIMVLGEDDWGLPAFHFTFEPHIIEESWDILQSRILPLQRQQLKSFITQFTPPTPDYRIVMEFSRQLLQNLPEISAIEARKTRINLEKISNYTEDQALNSCQPSEMELLQALTHEIRTPLTTIRTMVRLLQKRNKSAPDILKYLDVIDLECTEQINRMELIFRAAEMGMTSTTEKPVHLIPLSLEQIFQQNIPRWQKQAERRNITLDVILPKKLPQVVSDPGMLEQMLTGLIEKCTRTVPPNGQIQVQVSTAGHQLKLQFLSQSCPKTNPLKAIGQLLMFQPETGSLSLNMDVTKNIFHALGGKFVVRQRQQEGEVLTIFLPLGKGK
ncbi:sensor histidine kinase [Aphanothece hegewaldii CCALA 016]|uniref:histidine kinase n=1 Tax=Aphanothece hegewaldii CCALA 016 TaxID=2107694 RepID=A0A2T1M2K1_9CHRO|nr:HAMP domain-containing sensor histidine kinase [Aphanothece hegewaldii]PSF38970.1 sensor histidine kinase [Aphanothece hegewaldii CCALA 016]